MISLDQKEWTIMDSISIHKVSEALMIYSKILTLEVEMDMEKNGSFLLVVAEVDLMISLMTMMKKKMMTFSEDLNLVDLGTHFSVMEVFTQLVIEKMYLQMMMEKECTEMSDIQHLENQVSVAVRVCLFQPYHDKILDYSGIALLKRNIFFLFSEQQSIFCVVWSEWCWVLGH